MTPEQIGELLNLLVAFDDTIASDEPSHLACIILSMHCRRILTAVGE